MAIADENTKVLVTLTGAGQTIPVDFYFLADDHLKVTSTTGTTTTELVLNSDYTVTGAGNQGGGSVVMTAGVSGDKVAVTYNVPPTQTVNFTEGGAEPAETKERVPDKLTMLVKELKEKVSRALLSNATSSNTFPSSLTAQRFIYVDANGDPQLYTAAQVLALINLEIPTSVVDRPTTTFSDASARAAATPDFTRQIGIQLDTFDADPLGSIYVSGSTSAGDWDPITVSESDFSTTLAAVFDKLERAQDSLHPNPVITSPTSVGNPVAAYPETAGWEDDDFIDGTGALPSWATSTSYVVGDVVKHSGTNYICNTAHTSSGGSPGGNFTAAQHLGFPRAIFIPRKNRILVSFRVAQGHGEYNSTLCVVYSDDMGESWTFKTVVKGDDVDYRCLDLVHLKDDRILGVAAKVTGHSNDPTKTYSVVSYYSSDFGETWGSEGTIANAAANPATISSTGSSIQLKDGTIIVGVYTSSDYSSPFPTSVAKVVRSTDNGATWSSAITIADDTPTTGATEAAFFQKADGTVVSLVRSQDTASPSTSILWRTTSSDSGATWATKTDETPSNYYASKPVVAYTSNGLLWLVTRSYAGGGAVYYSSDDGVTFTGPLTGFVGSGGDERSDILNQNILTEGGFAKLNENSFLLFVGNETTIGGAASDIRLRSWLVGAADIGHKGNGLGMRDGGFIDFSGLTPPRSIDSTFENHTAVKGRTVYSPQTNCLMTYNGSFWESQASDTVPTINGHSAFLDLNPSQVSLGSLSSWTDQGSGSNNFTAAGTTPVATEKKLRGKPAVVFGGAGDYSDTAADWAFLFNGSTDYSLFVPFRVDEDDPQKIICLFGHNNTLTSSQNGFQIYLDNRSASSTFHAIGAYISNAAGGGNFPAAIMDDSESYSVTIPDRQWHDRTWHCVAVTYDADSATDPITGTLNLYLDGTLLGTDTDLGSTRQSITAAYDLHIGSGNGANYLTGRVGRVLCYKSLMTATDVARVSNALLR